MGRKRTISGNKGLPERWAFTHGAYYYAVPNGLERYWDGKKRFRLGETLAQAYAEWGRRIGYDTSSSTLGDILDRYMREVVPAKAPKTAHENAAYSVKIRKVFGHMRPYDIIPMDVYQYVDKREAKVSARREIALLSHVLTKAVEWGYINKHPFKGEVRLKTEKPRTRYVTDAEIITCLSLPPVNKGDATAMIQSYIRVKLLTGMRRGDMLRLKLVDLKDDGIHVKTSKTGKEVIYQWSDELKQAVELAKVVRRVHISPYLFCDRRGRCYYNEAKGTASGFDSIWGRFIKRVFKDKKDRFTEHDIRAKVASDAGSLEHARALLAHADSGITQKTYRRKPEIVVPLR